ncbi:MAG TPA: GNAT family N-acetyltransferase, partial [Chthoniobacterales bacterium]
MQPTCRVEIVQRGERLLALEGAWNALYDRAERPHLTQGFEWNRCLWEAYLRPLGVRLRCLVVHTSERVVLIWPFQVSRYHRFWRAARSLGSRNGDYCRVLVEAGPNAEAYVRRAWQALRQSRGVDLILAEHVPVDSLVQRVLSDPAPVASEPDTALHFDPTGFATFEAYQKQMPRQRQMKRHRRHLEENVGPVVFERVDDPERQIPLIAWMMERKVERLGARGEQPLWGRDSAAFQSFLMAVSGRIARDGAFVVFTLRAGTELLSVLIGMLDASRFLAFHFAFEPAYAPYGPGGLLKQDLVRWAFERGLPVDMMHGGNKEFKKTFCNREVHLLTHVYPVSPWGWVAVRL